MYQELLEGLKLNSIIEGDSSTKNTNNTNYDNSLKIVDKKVQLFSVDNFQQDLIEKSYKKNKYFADNTTRLNAYDIVHSCIRTVVFRMLGFPVKSYKDNWLPVAYRTTLGSATHDFIQNTSTSFTENEVYLRIPSKNISVKIDCITNDDTIIEIKSCTYSDYEKIVKNNESRSEDFYQALLYKMLLENHLEESKQQDLGERANKYNLPKLEKYNINKIQMIYVCHELLAADKSIAESIEFSKSLKRLLKSKFNTLWFIKDIVYDISNDKYKHHLDLINNRLIETQDFINKQLVPPMDHQFVDKTKCFFCLYKDSCKKYQ
jgi:hypothetical protein